jgi:hypothetical protein
MARQPSRTIGGGGLTGRELVSIVGLMALVLIPILASVVLPAPADWAGPSPSPQDSGRGGSSSSSGSSAGALSSAGTGSGTGSSSSGQVGSPNFDRCIRDDTTGNLFELDSKTGQYMFVRCLDGFNVTGQAAVNGASGVLSVTDSSATRKLSAEFNLGQQTGSMTATVKATAGVWQVFRVNSTKPKPICGCGG